MTNKEIVEAPKVFTVEKSLSNYPNSKQNETETSLGLLPPPISFYALGLAYDNSFILGGIFEKLAAAGNTGFIETKNKELDDLLKTIDLKLAFENILVFGNFFIEKVLGGNGKAISLVPFLTDTVRVWLLGGEFGYMQVVNGKRQLFLREEVIHARTTSLRNRYYGESKFSRAVKQIVLLSQIDEYYSSMFDKGMVGSCLLIDKGNKEGLPMGENNQKALGAWLQDNAAGIKNAFSTIIVPTELQKLDLDKNVDTKAFLEYRTELITSIAIALNIPVDLLIPKSSNRSTSEVAFDTLNDIIVKPMQRDFVRDLREGLRDKFGPVVDTIELVPSDSENEKQDMDIYTGYKKAGIMTPNEIRAKLNLPPIEGGDTLQPEKSQDNTQAVVKEIQDIQKSLQSVYE